MTKILAILALGLLIAFHELGHLLAARLFKIRVDRFSIGFGPPIFHFRRGATNYTLGAVPLGGFVRIHGMSAHEEDVDPNDPNAFFQKKAWQRMLVIFAGSFFNYLLAVVLLFSLYVVGTHLPVPLTIGTVQPGSEAARAQLRPGDKILEVAGEEPRRWTDLVEKIAGSANQPVDLVILREGERTPVQVKPRDDNGVGRLGISEQYVYRRLDPGEAIVRAVSDCNAKIAETFQLFGMLFRRVKGVELSSPIGIVSAASQAAGSGADAFFRVLVSISVALAIFNLLPIPALDGGRLMFLIKEAITGRPVNAKTETLAHSIGFIALIALVLVVAVGDVRKLFRPKPPATTETQAPAADGGTPPPAPDAGTP